MPHSAAHETWSQEQEELLAEWCDHAKCYVLMHSDAEAHYSRMHRWSSAAVLSLGVLCGMANVTSGASIAGFPTSWLFGSVTVLVQLGHVVLQSLAYNARERTHDELGKAWGELQSKLEHQLSIPRAHRTHAVELYKLVTPERDKLRSRSNGAIPQFVMERFKVQVAGDATLALPEMCGGLRHTSVAAAFVEPVLEAVEEELPPPPPIM